MLTRAEKPPLWGQPCRRIALDEVDADLIRQRLKSWRLYRLPKRALDLLIVILALPAAIPILILCSLAILIASGRPVFFLQDRVGLNKRVFKLIKLRTMCVQKAADVQATSRNDPRITAIGAFLRKSHMDELPQLWNVLVGDMSLIGPRPEQPGLVARYETALPHYELRHIVRPGLSGWAQVYFGYASELHETRIKLEHDLYYLQNYGPTIDLIVFVRTLWVYLKEDYVR